MAEFLLNETTIWPVQSNTSLSICNFSCESSSEKPIHQEADIYDDVLTGLKYVNIFLLPTCLVLGVSGNIVTMFVMNTNYFTKFTSRYFLLSLAISDNLLLLTQPFNQLIVINFFGRDLRALSDLGCRLYFWFFKNGKMTSSWFVVFLCFERFVAVQFPFKVKAIFCKRNCLLAIAMVYITMGVYNGVWSWAHQIKDGYCYPDGYNKSDPKANALFRNMLIAGVSMYSIVPIIIMVIITPMIIIQLARRTKLRRELTGNQGKELELARISTMLLSIVITYIVCVAPVTALHVISFYQGLHAFGENPKPFMIYRDTSQILEQLNYTVNFFLYVVSNRKFRRAVITLFHLENLPCCKQAGLSRGFSTTRKSFKSGISVTSDYGSGSGSISRGTEKTENDKSELDCSK